VLFTVPKAKMLSETLNFAQKEADNRALKTVRQAFRKNGSENDHSVPLEFAYLACAAVQHEGAKQEKYDALLYF
jgi:transcriptional/translational regulatory protein YebC/TACO1